MSNSIRCIHIKCIILILFIVYIRCTRAAVVYLNFRVGSTFPVTVCTVPNSVDRTSRCNKVDAVRLYASYRLNLLLLKGQRHVNHIVRLWYIKVAEETLLYFYNFEWEQKLILPLDNVGSGRSSFLLKQIRNFRSPICVYFKP